MNIFKKLLSVALLLISFISFSKNKKNDLTKEVSQLRNELNALKENPASSDEFIIELFKYENPETNSDNDYFHSGLA